jgi:hypothetical protein
VTRLWHRFRGLPRWAQVLAWLALWPVPLGLWAAAKPKDRRTGPAVLAAASAAVWIAVLVSSASTPDRVGQADANGKLAAPPAGGVPSTTDPTSALPPEATTTTAAEGSSTTAPQIAGSGPAKAATTTTTKPPSSADPIAVLAGLRIAPEGARVGYDRDLFVHWVDADRDGCDTREEVLIAESRGQAQVDPYGCKVLAGDWYSLYDGLTFTVPSELDVDHMVPLAEAWDSGASGWDAARRRAFANDLDHPQALRAVSASSNRSKSDLDPGQWKPTRDAAWCEYANDWVTVKKAWDLTADQNEVDDLTVMLRTCTASSTTARPPPIPSTTTTTYPTVSGGTITITALDCPGEAVTVGNGGSSPADLTGWSIHDDGPNFTYAFPAGYTLAPAASVTVRSGGVAGLGELGWTSRSVWNNTGDTAHLVNAGGAVVSMKSC